MFIKLTGVPPAELTALHKILDWENRNDPVRKLVRKFTRFENDEAKERNIEQSIPIQILSSKLEENKASYTIEIKISCKFELKNCCPSDDGAGFSGTYTITPSRAILLAMIDALNILPEKEMIKRH